MGYSTYLKKTLKPLGIYELDTGLGAAELDILGAAMDGIEEQLSLTFREMLPMTAENEGLNKYESLLPEAAPKADTDTRRSAIMTLIRLGECECSDQGLNHVLASCGIPANVSETDVKETLKITILEPQLEDDELQELKRRIEAILPCHLDLVYA